MALGLSFDQTRQLLSGIALIMAIGMLGYILFVYPGGAEAVKNRMICTEEAPVLQAIQSGKECVSQCSSFLANPYGLNTSNSTTWFTNSTLPNETSGT